MCVIVASRRGIVPTIDELRMMEFANPDGVGIAWYDKGASRLWYAKSTKLEGVEVHLPSLDGNPYLIHFRLATHGKVSTENTHPFVSPCGSYLVAHNGILSGYGSRKLSDTRDYLATRWGEILGDYNGNWLEPEFGERVSADIGTSNKFVLLDNTGELRILNAGVGNWDAGYWVSNDHWRVWGDWRAKFAQPKALTASAGAVGYCGLPDRCGHAWGGDDESESTFIDVSGSAYVEGWPQCQWCEYSGPEVETHTVWDEPCELCDACYDDLRNSPDY